MYDQCYYESQKIGKWKVCACMPLVPFHDLLRVGHSHVPAFWLVLLSNHSLQGTGNHLSDSSRVGGTCARARGHCFELGRLFCLSLSCFELGLHNSRGRRDLDCYGTFRDCLIESTQIGKWSCRGLNNATPMSAGAAGTFESGGCVFNPCTSLHAKTSRNLRSAECCGLGFVISS